MRHEAPARGRADWLCLPDAPGGDERTTRPLSEVRNEAGTGALVASGEGHSHAHDEHDHGEHQHEVGGIEWEDDMVDVNRLTTPANTRWKLIDRSDDAENHAIS